MSDTVYLTSGEVVNLKLLLNTLIEIGWGVQKLQSVIAFGSSVKPIKFQKMNVRKVLWWELYKKQFIHPNDIDLLVVYDKRVKQNELTAKHTSTIQIVVEDGYGGILSRGVRIKNLHLFCISKNEFEKKLSEGEKYATSVFNEGVVIWGSNSLILRSATTKNYLYVEEYELAEALLSKQGCNTKPIGVTEYDKWMNDA